MKKMLEKIDYSNPENKYQMNELFEMAMCSVKDNDRELYDHIKCEIYEMVYGKKISDEMADNWVHGMKPMAKWTKEQVLGVAQAYGIDMPINSAYVLFNMKYSDNRDVLGDGETEDSLMNYIKAVKDFYFDEDYNGTGEEKTFDYGKYIVKVQY